MASLGPTETNSVNVPLVKCPRLQRAEVGSWLGQIESRTERRVAGKFNNIWPLRQFIQRGKEVQVLVEMRGGKKKQRKLFKANRTNKKTRNKERKYRNFAFFNLILLLCRFFSFVLFNFFIFLEQYILKNQVQKLHEAGLTNCNN